jgi:Flp pilus assembly protein TadG
MTNRKAKPGTACRRIRSVEGAAVVELALISSILFAMVLGAMETCLAFYAHHATAEAARQGSRWAMVRGSTSCTNTPNLSDCNATAAEIQTYVSELGYLNIPTSDVTVSWLTASGLQPSTWSACSTGTCNLPGNEVQVVVTYPFATHIPGFPHTTWNISSTSAVVISQ